MKNVYSLPLIFALCLFSMQSVTVSAQTGYYGPRFNVIAGSGNTQSQMLIIDNPACNGDGSKMLFYTRNFEPNDVTDTHNTGLWYNGVNWTIFNENVDSITWGQSFNVLVAETGGTAFTAHSTAANTVLNYFFLDHPLLNNHPDAICFVEHNYGSTYLYLDHVTGVFYDDIVCKWAVYNQDMAAMDTALQFNVFVPDSSDHAFVHEADSLHTPSVFTLIDHPLLNNNPDAIFFVTYNWNPSLSAGIYNNKTIGVFYSAGIWGIFNEDMSQIPIGSHFNVLIADESSSVEETSNATQMGLFPNPAVDFLQISDQEKETEVVNVCDLAGRVLLSTHTDNGRIDISALPSGLFIVRHGNAFGKFIK